jgi:hypothetical protein
MLTKNNLALNKFMQTNPVFTPPIAVLDNYQSAGQFKIQNGQLIQLISAPGDEPQFVYATAATNTTHKGTLSCGRIRATTEIRTVAHGGFARGINCLLI